MKRPRYSHIRLKNSNLFAKMDPKDRPLMSQYRWELGVEGYPIRRERVASGRKAVIGMPHQILGVSEDEIIRFRNGKPLDNRRENLEIVDYYDSLPYTA